MERNLIREAAHNFPGDVIYPYGMMMGLDGFDAIFEMQKHLGGQTVYIPGARTIFKTCIHNQIRAAHNGFNNVELAQKYEYTVKQIQRITS